MKAVTAPKGNGSAGRAGRSIAAAISALSTQTGDRARLARLFGRQPQTIRAAQVSGRPAFADAELAARSAVAAAQANARLAWSQQAVGLGEEITELGRPSKAFETLVLAGRLDHGHDTVVREVVLPPQAEAPPAEPDPPVAEFEPVRRVAESDPPAAPKRFFRDAGTVTAHVRPPPIAPRVVMPMASLSDRILTTLERGPRNTSSLAVELEVKELLVGQCLSALRHEKRVRSDASLGLGRAMLWLLAEQAVA